MRLNLVKAYATGAIALFLGVATAPRADGCGKKPWDAAILSANSTASPATELAALAASQAKEEGTNETSIVGMWIVTFYVEGKQWDFGIEQFHSDGTETTNDIYAPAVGNICFGIWEQVPGISSVRLKHTGTFDGSGVYAGLFDLSASLNVSKDGSSFNGKFVADQEDLDGKVIPSMHVEGILKANDSSLIHRILTEFRSREQNKTAFSISEEHLESRGRAMVWAFLL